MINKKAGIILISVGLLFANILFGCKISEYKGSNENTTELPYTGQQQEKTLIEISASRITLPEIPVSADGIKGTVYIKLLDCSAEIEGSGASVDGNTILIDRAGDFVITGSTSSQKLIVDSQESGNVKIILNGAYINCMSGAAINIVNSNAGKTIIEAAAGSTNIISVSTSKTGMVEAKEDAAILSSGNLKLEGFGTLYVKSVYRGIESKGDLEIENLVLYVAAAGDGIRGKDSLTIRSGEITVESAEDGLRTNKTGNNKGFISISGGCVDIDSAGDAVQASTDLEISGGEITLISGGGISNDEIETPENKKSIYKYINPPAQSADENKISKKGLKAGKSITIKDCMLCIDSADDGLHSDGIIDLQGGSVYISSDDDGIHAKTKLHISGGEITIADSYEGIESAAVIISGGVINIKSKDDGINSTVSTKISDENKQDQQPEQNSGIKDNTDGGNPGKWYIGMEPSDGSTIEISGGTIIINADGDGIDCNGDITVSGGFIVIYGPVKNNNGALDYNRSFSMNGGVLLALGSSGLARGIGEESKQSSLFFSINGEEKKEFKIIDTEGLILIDVIPPKKYTSIVFSSPDIHPGALYTVIYGENTASVTAK